jgi:hypothetical protein
VEEIWKDIPSWEGYYMCSSLGRIKSLPRIVVGRKHPTKERILKYGVSSQGYHHVCLCNHPISTNIMVHISVANCFLEYGRSSLLVVDHINNIKTDNRVDNLQIISIRLNTIKSLLTKYGQGSKYVGVTWEKDKKKVA